MSLQYRLSRIEVALSKARPVVIGINPGETLEEACLSARGTMCADSMHRATFGLLAGLRIGPR